MSTELLARITCPLCRVEFEAEIPERARQLFWHCPACEGVIVPKSGDCCVFCSYADRRCPSADSALAGELGTSGGPSRG